MRLTCFFYPDAPSRRHASKRPLDTPRHAHNTQAPMVRKYIGNGQWADVPGTAPTKTTTNLDLDAALEEVATRFLVHLPDSE